MCCGVGRYVSVCMRVCVCVVEYSDREMGGR